MTATVIAHAARSGIAALNVVTAALDADPRTRALPVVFAKSAREVAAAIAAASGPVVVAHSFYSTDFARAAAELAAMPRERALHVAGGVHATAEPSATLAAGFDLAVIGEGEHAFVELCAAVAGGRDPRGGPGTAWRDRDGALARGPAAPRRPLDDFPAANLRHGRWNPLEITRGCVYACSFCQTPFMFKARFRHRSVADVRAHVRAMVAGGLRYVRYVSPTSLSYGSPDTGVNLPAVEALLAAVRAELPPGGKQYFGTFPSEVRPEHVSAEALALIARHADNRSLVIGGQSGSERLLAATHRGHDVAAIERAVALCGEAGFRADVDFLFGLPGEDDVDRAHTIALAERITALGARIHAHAFMPLPGTPLAGAAPTAIAPALADAVARLESRGAAYGQWRAQAQLADDLVQLRARRPRRVDV
ncbi:MAG TPA: TIGR04013 family B12-binding domain/radical SAM domain-containing protein [Kofleriaceae bacterium]|nr:TIGR04013 family B12-binding domain/radical SAM domain-containing protein [Kofleriaceae bacterium]